LVRREREKVVFCLERETRTDAPAATSDNGLCRRYGRYSISVKVFGSLGGCRVTGIGHGCGGRVCLWVGERWGGGARGGQKHWEEGQPYMG